MGYRMIAVDIDGTLLNSRGEITECTKDAIRKLQRAGGILTIASGRPIHGVEYICGQLGLDLPFITYNGAMVVMGSSKEILYEQRLDEEQVLTIVELGVKLDTTVMVWRENRLYANRMDDKSERYARLVNVPVNIIDEPSLLAAGGATKVLWYDTEENMHHLKHAVSEAGLVDVNWHTSQPIFLEFVHGQASKAIAMEKLGQHFGIQRDEMIAIGDGENDLSMIEYAGLGVAMGNAPDKVKERAMHIAASNDEDGVAGVIEEFMLGV